MKLILLAKRAASYSMTAAGQSLVAKPAKVTPQLHLKLSSASSSDHFLRV